MPVTLLIPSIILLTTPMKKLATAAHIVSQFFLTSSNTIAQSSRLSPATAIALPGRTQRTIAASATAADCVIMRRGVFLKMN